MIDFKSQSDLISFSYFDNNISLSQPNDDSFESEISKLNKEYRIYFRNYIIKNIQALANSEDMKNPNKMNEVILKIQSLIEKLSKLISCETPIEEKDFFYIVKHGLKIELLKETIYKFMVSSFQQNPKLVEKLFSYEKQNINEFLDIFSKPFDKVYYDFILILINFSREFCDVLICNGLVNKIEEGIFTSIQYGGGYGQFWSYALKILKAIVQNCSINLILFCSVSDLCVTFFGSGYPKDVILQSIHCLNELFGRVSDESFRSKINDFLPFFDQILSQSREHNEVFPVIRLIKTSSVDNKKVDLYGNRFIQYLIGLASNWPLNEFEDIFDDFFTILNYCLKFHPKLIGEILKSNILSIASSYMSDGGFGIKRSVSLFFARLLDSFFWNSVFDFFEKNSQIVATLFVMINMEIDEKTKLAIIHALASLAVNIKMSPALVPSVVAQFKLNESVEAFIEAQNSESVSVRYECAMLKKAVNELIKDGF